MKTLLPPVLAMMLATTFASTASALSITPLDADWSGPEHNTPQVLTAVEAAIGSSTLLYKAEVDPLAEEGPLAGSYQTTFIPTSDPDGADIEYVAPPHAEPTTFLLVKGGNDPKNLIPIGWYLFNLSDMGWDGIETIELRGFWPANGAISHIELRNRPQNVPDGGTTVGLLGLGLLGIAIIRRTLIRT